MAQLGPSGELDENCPSRMVVSDQGDVEEDDSGDEDDDSLFPWKSIVPHLAFGAFIRLALVFYGVFHDQLFRLKYTDVDYVVFTDGAKYLVEGRSPFLRDGYRYTPLLALMVAPNVILMKIFGKLLFIIFDLATGYLIYKILSNINTAQITETARVTAAAIWLYNPLPLIISTRGSSDSIMTALVLLVLFYLVKEKHLAAGLTFGFAIHFKLYPVIYIPAIYLYLSNQMNLPKSKITLAMVNPLNAKRLTFFTASLLAFTSATYLSYHLYGKKYLNEAWRYHLTRLDTQHNFSIYFYIFRNCSGLTVALTSKLALLLQALTMVYSCKFVIWPSVVSYKTKESFYMGLVFSTFLSTYLFVSLNKVVTSQYFIWYFCLIPLIIPILSQQLSSKQLTSMLVVWLTAQGIWLFPAYLYEFMNLNTALLYVWLASVVFLIVNLAIARKLVLAYGRVVAKKQQVK